MTVPPRAVPPHVWDASALHHVGRADRLDVLGEYVKGPPGRPWTHVTTEHDAVAIVGDHAAVATMRANGCRAHGSLRLLCRAVDAGTVDETSASSLVDAALNAGARFPFTPGGFLPWARKHGLL